MPGLIHALALPDTGFISLVGGGGKSTLLLRLARERQARGLRTVVTTTTRILRAQGEAAGPVAGDLPALEAALAQSLTVCAALPAPEMGKLAPPSQALLDQALNLAGLVVAEADGAHGRPVKAPAGYEPCLLPHSAAVVAVAGLSALGRPLEEVCHRPELAARLLGTSLDILLTPELLARLLASREGQFKGVGDLEQFRILLNQADGPEGLAMARETAAAIRTLLPGVPVVAAALREPEPVKEAFFHADRNQGGGGLGHRDRLPPVPEWVSGASH